jgi:hypothetical protein
MVMLSSPLDNPQAVISLETGCRDNLFWGLLWGQVSAWPHGQMRNIATGWLPIRKHEQGI